jgi:protein-disulfide isomerase
MDKNQDRFSQFMLIGIVSVVSIVVVAVLVYSNRPRETDLDHLEQVASLPRGIDVMTGLPYLGEADAPVDMIVYEDLGCPNCRNFFTTVEPGIISEFVEEGKVRLLIFTLAFVNASSLPAAEGVACALDQDYFWVYRDVVFNNQGVNQYNRTNMIQFAEDVGMDVDQFSECFDLGTHKQAIIERSQTAYEFGITGTPTSEINGVRYPGVVPFDSESDPVGIKQLLDAAFEKANDN